MNNSEIYFNSAREGPKSGYSPLFNDHSIVIIANYVQAIPKFNESDFESANESILDTSNNEKILNDISILNDPQEFKNNYLSFSSDAILSQNVVTPKDENKNNYIVDEILMQDLNGFSNKKYDFFYIEFHYFLLWNKIYLKMIYPDLNFILTIEINDDKSSIEKIVLARNGDNRYFPQRIDSNSEVIETYYNNRGLSGR